MFRVHPPPGRIVTRRVISIICGYCGSQEDCLDDRTIKEARSNAVGRGWQRWKLEGYVCPDCCREVIFETMEEG